MKAQARLLDNLCQSLPEDRLECIGSRSERRGAIQVMDNAWAAEDQGLEGDHRMTKKTHPNHVIHVGFSHFPSFRGSGDRRPSVL